MKILLTGKDGQVGHELERRLAPLGDVTACDRARLDLAKADDVVAAMRGIKPDVVVNAAAYTAVDKAESEPELARAINSRAPGIFAEEARKLGALLVHYSTDYVFDGTKANPYVEEDTPSPLNAYGRTKLEGERAVAETGARHLIFRTSWVYGPRGRNFYLTVLRMAREGRSLRVVADQFGAPTTSAMIAEYSGRAIERHLETGSEGLFHFTSGGKTSWYEFAVQILSRSGVPGRIEPIQSGEYPTAALRPANSRLDNKKLHEQLGISLPAWEKGLDSCIAESAR